MTTLRMTVFSGSSIGVATAPTSVEGPLALRLLGTPVCFPSVEKQSRTLLPAIDLAVLAVSEGAEVSLSLPAAAAAVCVATAAAGFDSADVLLMAIADPAEAESKRIDRITNNHTTQQARGGGISKWTGSKAVSPPVPNDEGGRTEMIMDQKDKRYIVSTRQQHDEKMQADSNQPAKGESANAPGHIHN